MTERPNIARAKRRGLELDLSETCARGAAALEPDDHYRLKTYGVCAQRQEDRFMLRMRATGGRLDARKVAAIREAADRFAGGWVHLTTRQNVELHSICLEDVPEIYDVLAPAGLVGRSACGHTIRNVMACPDSATSIEEPFDVAPDAARVSSLLVARSRELNARLPSRVNIVFGGCSRCHKHALTNDIGLVAQVRDGVPGYQLWTGGSMGAAPRLSFMLRPFVARDEVWPAIWSIISWFCDEGDVEQVAKGRLKFLIEEKGESSFRNAFAQRFISTSTEPQPALDEVEIFGAPDLAASFALPPQAGWRDGVSPQRQRGLATVTVRVPLGDLLASELGAIADLSPDGSLAINPEQNLAIKSIAVGNVDRVVGELAALGLGPDGIRNSADVTACPGLSFCPLAITRVQEVGLEIEGALGARPDLSDDFGVAVSGCPNSCTKQQVGDIGFAGGKVRINGMTRPGYQLYLGADLSAGLVGEPVMKLADDEIPHAVVAIAELWIAFRREGERPGHTFRRVGLDVVARAVETRLRVGGHDPEVEIEVAGKSAPATSPHAHRVEMAGVA